MRMLLMISNNNMSLREFYTTILDNHAAGWVTSFMSGLPDGIGAIVAGYDAVIYEIGAADGAERVSSVKALRATGIPVITHLEGRQAAQRAQELQAVGAVIVPNPLSGARIEAALDALIAGMRTTKKQAQRAGIRGIFRRLLDGV